MIAQLDSKLMRLRPGRALARLISHVLLQGRPLTTKGRWLNHLLIPQYRIIKKLPQIKRVTKPIFILGTGRSGTTILGKIVSLHPHICFLNEPKALWYAIYDGEDLIGSYTRNDARYNLSEQDVNSDIIKAAHKLYAYSLLITSSKRILDKYPELIFRLPFVQEIFPDAKFIFLVRNGWDTCQSINDWSQKEGVSTAQEHHDWWGADRRKWKLLLRDVVAQHPQLSRYLDALTHLSSQADMAAVEWIVSMQKGLALEQQYASSIQRIYYEDLVLSPKETLSKILNFCELPHDDVLIQYASETLRPLTHKARYNMHPMLTKSFLETMEQLGYRK